MHKMSTRKDTKQNVKSVYIIWCYTSVSIATFLTDVNMDIAVKYKIA